MSALSSSGSTAKPIAGNSRAANPKSIQSNPKKPTMQTPKNFTGTKTNKLLIPKWKQRTSETHAKHLAQLCSLKVKANPPHILLLGSSMLERWFNTGKEIWASEEMQSFKPFNAGIGGDTIQTVLWRISPEEIPRRLPPTAPLRVSAAAPASTGDSKQSAGFTVTDASSSSLSSCSSSCSSSSLLAHLSSVHTTFVMVGTNNLSENSTTAEQLVEGIAKILHVLENNLTNLKRIVVYALLPRADVPSSRIDQVNELIRSEVKTNHPNAIFTDELARIVQLDKHYVDDVHLNRSGYALWWSILQKQMQEASTFITPASL